MFPIKPVLLRDNSRSLRKLSPAFLAFFWMAGFFSGQLALLSVSNAVLPLMRGLLYAPVSIVSLLTVNLLPFLISAFAVSVSAPWLLLILGFLKAFCFAVISGGLVLVFPESAWLLRVLALFSETVSMPVLYYRAHSFLRTGRASCAGFFLAVGIVILICSLDFCIISPFAASMIDSCLR